MKRIKRYIPASAFTLLIPLLSLISPEHLPDAGSLNFAGLDKIVHMLMYALLTLIWAFSATDKLRVSLRNMLLLAIGTSLYGLIMEVLQFCLTSTRSMDMLDATANFAGALFASLTAFSITRGRTKTAES